MPFRRGTRRPMESFKKSRGISPVLGLRNKTRGGGSYVEIPKPSRVELKCSFSDPLQEWWMPPVRPPAGVVNASRETSCRSCECLPWDPLQEWWMPPVRPPAGVVNASRETPAGVVNAARTYFSWHPDEEVHDLEPYRSLTGSPCIMDITEEL
jgi:hypothetical protein